MNETVGIAELKSRLSKYLRAVRAGHSLTVLDRDKPVARLMPFTPDSPLTIRSRSSDSPRPGDVPPPPPLRLTIDAVELLLEDRGKR